MNILKFVKDSKFLLLSIAAGLVTLQFHLIIRSEKTDELGTFILFLVAIYYLIEKKCYTLNFQSDIFSSLVGASAIGVVLLKSLHLTASDPFFRISPFILFLGLALLASGVQGLKQYRQELLLLSFLATPRYWLSLSTNLHILTAQFTSFTLNCLGFNAFRQDKFVTLPTGAIEVNYGCSGINIILQLMGISLIFLVLFPTKKIHKILLPVGAILLAFFLNGIRVVLMAILVASSQKEAFVYWHEGNGSLVFSLLAVVIFSLSCSFLFQQSANENS